MTGAKPHCRREAPGLGEPHGPSETNRSVTAFDVFALIVIAGSACVGVLRGAVREVIGFFALTLSAVGALALLPFLSPLVKGLLRPEWIAVAGAAILAFVAIYTVLLAVAGLVTKALDATVLLGGVNRLIGFLLGALRGVALLALFALLLTRVAPPSLQPDWIKRSASFPLAQTAGQVLQIVLPKRLAIDRSVLNIAAPHGSGEGDEAVPSPDSTGSPDNAVAPTPHHRRIRGAKSADHGYTTRTRTRVDELVEQSQ